eukprot:Skav214826  [mRNA]  locus=scaffold1772:84288:90965:+ [translate_table: standard]
MSADDDVDTSEAHQIQAIQDIETSASKASNDLMEARNPRDGARKLVSNRLRESNKKYAPEAKKVAQQEFEAMEKRLGEASKRLQPLKKFRQEFEQKIAAKKALQEIQNKLNSAELEIEKAAQQRSVRSVDVHIKDWDSQIDFALNESNCSDFLEYVYLSRDRIRAQLDYVRGNFTAEDEAFRLQGAIGGSSAWAMTHMSQAASLLSAHIHIHGILSGALVASRDEGTATHSRLPRRSAAYDFGVLKLPQGWSLLAHPVDPCG